MRGGVYMSVMPTINCLGQPMVFVQKGGGLFKARSFKSKSYFTTEFFLITQINEAKGCLTLMLLRPCYVCCDEAIFIPMDECITMDMSCFCGYQPIAHACIRACDHPPIRMKDCICGRFTILPGNDETVLWQSNITAEQYGTISLSIKSGQEEPLTLILYFNDSMEYKTYQLRGQKSYEFSMANCSFIKILSPHVTARVQGTFEINVEHVIEHWDIW